MSRIALADAETDSRHLDVKKELSFPVVGSFSQEAMYPVFTKNHPSYDRRNGDDYGDKHRVRFSTKPSGQLSVEKLCRDPQQG